MKNNQIVLNFLVFAEKIANGRQQNELLADIKALGLSLIHI